MMSVLNQLLVGSKENFFDRWDYERVAKRFPVPKIRRAASPEDIAGLSVGTYVSYLGTFIRFISQGTTQSGKYYLNMELTDETGHMQAVVWRHSNSRIEEMRERIGHGKEAVVSGVIHDWPLGSDHKQMTIDNINFDDAIPTVVEPSLLGTIDTVMQIVPALEQLPAPYANLASDCLERYWGELLNSIDQGSTRHRYYGGILGHLRAVLKVLDYLYSESSPDRAMVEIAKRYQSLLVSGEGVAAGAEGTPVYLPVSIDYLHRILTKTQEALNNPAETLCPWMATVAAVYAEVGKLALDKRIGSDTYGAQCLWKISNELGLSNEEIAPIVDLIISRPALFEVSATPRSADAWILHLADYLASAVG